MPANIQAADLASADVLLYRGEGLLAKAIRFFDGADVNHAGLYLGNNSVGEALSHGVVQQGLPASLAGHTLVVARRLKATDLTGPVKARADSILAQGQRYAYEQLLLLAFLALTRKLKLNRFLRWTLRSVLDAAAALLAKIASGATGGKEPMICSEFVYRCYHEALPTPNDVYELEVNPLRAQLGVAAIALPVGRGQGIHRQSVLAKALSRPRAGMVPAAPPAAARAEELAKVAETALGRYLRAASAPGLAMGAAPSTEPEPPAVTDAEVDASVEAFAIAWWQSVASAHGVGALTPDLLTTVGRAAADFVTPGDLFRTQSLQDAGRLL